MNGYTHWACAVSSASSSEPVSVDDLKIYLRIGSTETAEDSVLETLITVARKNIEALTGRSLLRQVYTLQMDGLPGESTEPVILPIAPLISSSGFSVTTYDDDNTASVWSTSEYRLDTVSEPGRLVCNDAYDWPDDLREQAAVSISFAAGYSTSSTGVPEPLTLATKAWAAYLYEHRGDETGKDAAEGGVPSLVRVLVQDYILPVLG